MHRRTWISRATLIASALATALAAPLAFGQAKEIKIAHIYSKTGPGRRSRQAFRSGRCASVFLFLFSVCATHKPKTNQISVEHHW